MAQQVSDVLGMHKQDWPCTSDATNHLINHARTAYSLVNGEPNEAFLAAVATDYLQHGAGETSAQKRMKIMNEVGDKQLAAWKSDEEKMQEESAPTESVMSLSKTMQYLQEKGMDTGAALDVIAEIPEDQPITEAYVDRLLVVEKPTKSKAPAVQDRNFYSKESPMGMGSALHYLESVHQLSAMDSIDVLSTLSDGTQQELYPQTLDDAVGSWKKTGKVESGSPVEAIESPAVMEKHDDEMVVPAPEVMPVHVTKSESLPKTEEDDQMELIRDYLVEAGIVHEDDMVRAIDQLARTTKHEQLGLSLLKKSPASFTGTPNDLEAIFGYVPEDEEEAIAYMAYVLQSRESLYAKLSEEAGPQMKQSVLKKWWNGLLGKKQ